MNVLTWLDSLHVTDESGAVTNQKWPEAQEAHGQVTALIESHKASIAEIESLRDAMFGVYATAHNDGDVILAVERMRDVMERPWSVDKSRAAIAKATSP